MAMASAPIGIANAPVAELDLARYTGKWHEIAHLPMYFQRNCINDITATHRPGTKLSRRAFGRERRYPITSGYAD